MIGCSDSRAPAGCDFPGAGSLAKFNPFRDAA